MNIEEERMAFEEYLISQGVDLKYIPSIHFNGCIYDQGDDFDEDQQEALGEINLGWNAWQASANREGFVLIKNDPKTIVAIEQMVEQQVEASGITQDVFRLDGERILEAMLSAQEQSNESN